MITRNGKAYLWPAKAVYDTDNSECDVDNTLRSTVGDAFQIASAQMDAFKVICGTGSTAPTVNDIALVDMLTKDTLTEISSDATQKPRSYVDNFIASYTTTWQNNTGADIVIRELGVIFAAAGRDYLIARQLIEPTTLRAGKTYTLTMTIG